MGLRIRLENKIEAEEIRSIMLQCQIRIETTRRPYTPSEQRQLRDLFGTPERWNQTLHSMLWTNGSVVVPPFRGATSVDLPVPCTFDLTVATAKYFNGLEAGAVPLTLLFSGSVFYLAADDRLQVTQIAWDKEASFALPVEDWKKMMDAHYPNMAWLGVRRDVFNRLYRYKMDRGMATWEQTLESILP
jgi:hypothetical protein